MQFCPQEKPLWSLPRHLLCCCLRCWHPGMNKMVINHLEKLFVTSDASTIVTEMDVYHPAAKLLVMAAKAQAGEVGDGTNLVSVQRQQRVWVR